MEEEEILKSPKEGRTACCIFGCKNNKTNRPDLSFHRLPSVRDLQANNEEAYSRGMLELKNHSISMKPSQKLPNGLITSDQSKKLGHWQFKGLPTPPVTSATS